MLYLLSVPSTSFCLYSLNKCKKCLEKSYLSTWSFCVLYPRNSSRLQSFRRQLNKKCRRNKTFSNKRNQSFHQKNMMCLQSKLIVVFKLGKKKRFIFDIKNSSRIQNQRSSASVFFGRDHQLPFCVGHKDLLKLAGLKSKGTLVHVVNQKKFNFPDILLKCQLNLILNLGATLSQAIKKETNLIVETLEEESLVLRLDYFQIDFRRSFYQKPGASIKWLQWSQRLSHCEQDQDFDCLVNKRKRQILDNILIVMYRFSYGKSGQKLFKIKSKKSGKQLGLSTDPQTMGVLILKQPSNDPSQIFTFDYERTHHVIRSQLNSHCLTVYRGSKEPGTMIVTLPQFKSQSQKFYLRRMQKQNQFVIATFYGKLLDCYEQGTDEGTIIIQLQASDKPHQIWVIEQI